MRPRLFGSLVGLLALAGFWAGAPVVSQPGAGVAGQLQSPAFVPTRSASALLRVLSALDPNSRVLRAIAIDLDVDGDLDLVATTTDEVVVVWVNDGPGRLVRQTRPIASRLSSLPSLDRSSSRGGAAAAVSGPSAARAILAAVADNSRPPAVFPISPSSRGASRHSDAGSGRAPPVRV